MIQRTFGFIALLGLCACTPATDPDAGPQIPDAGEDAGSPEDPDAGPPAVCPDVQSAGILEHPFDRTCTEDADCGFASVQRDCCGTQTAFAVHVDERAELVEWGATCGALFPECACASQPNFDDIGGQAATTEDEPAVGCVGGVCLTSYATVGEPAPVCFDLPAAQATFQRSCSVDTDCQVELVFSGCCGEQHALGVNAAGAPAARLWSSSCREETLCDCVPFEVTADFGPAGPLSADGVVVDCVESVCTTSFQQPG